VLAVRAKFAPGCGSDVASLSISLEALGDFEASTLTSDGAPGDARGLPLTFPAKTRAVSSVAQGGGLSWSGLGEATGGSDIDLLLWRRDDACDAWGSQPGFLAEPKGTSVGYLPSHHLLLAAGSLVQSADAARAFTWDLATGESREVPDGMLPARAYASITAFGEDAMLVAGGVDPSLGSASLDDAPPIDSATLFDASTLSFDRATLIPLSQPRSRHGAVTLQGGDTLLVGGQGPGAIALPTLEAISPAERAARVAGLATLKHARVAPTVLRLDDGRIFVGGGTDGGAPVNALEWLTPDAASLSVIQENAVVSDRAAFAPLLGGGVLGVGVCVPKPAAGCAGDLARRAVTWIRADGSLDALPSLSFTPDSLALIPAADGAPWLSSWAGTTHSWKRFDPWNGLFDEPTDAPSSAPDADLAAPVAVEPGLFTWLERDGSKARWRGFRHDTRGPYARDVAPLLLAGREHVTPSRAPFDLATSGIEYGAGGLGLSGSNVAAFVTDTTYANVSLEIELTSGAAPVVLLGDTRVGDGACPWPATSGDALSLRRSGTDVILQRGGAKTHCKVANGRLALGLAGRDGEESRVRSLTIRRE